ncbi:MAG: homoserine kinase [Alphaproteobacteria bacterium]|nr:homoserine kinase [Alphaproteobacteria bacterium]
MAVYTHVTKSELDAHLALYDIGGLVDYAGILSGVSNTNYKVMTDKGAYILTLLEERADEDSMDYVLGFMRHLRQAGLPVAAPVAARDGATLLPLMGRASLLTVFLEGGAPVPTSVACCRVAGAALARMHIAGGNFSRQRRNPMDMTACRTLVEHSDEGAEKLEKGLGRFLLSVFDDLMGDMPKDLPRGAVHTDFFPNNTLFSGDDLTGVFDFYFSCTDSFVYDLMIAVNAWCFDSAVFNADKAKAFLQGYAAVRPLTQDEIAALPVMGRAGALRYASSRLYDWLHRVEGADVVPHDPMEYVHILRFHQSASAQDYGLAA